mgnify:CR=1 FL=1
MPSQGGWVKVKGHRFCPRHLYPLRIAACSHTKAPLASVLLHFPRLGPRFGLPQRWKGAIVLLLVDRSFRIWQAPTPGAAVYADECIREVRASPAVGFALEFSLGVARARAAMP